MNKRKVLYSLSGAVVVILTVTIISVYNAKSRSSNETTEAYQTIESDQIVDENQATEAGLAENTLRMAEDSNSNQLFSASASEILDTAIETEETWEITEEHVTEIENLVKQYYTIDKFNEELIVSQSIDDTEEIKDEILEKRDGIEAYKKIKVNIRKGLKDDTFIVFTTYKTKFYNIDTLAPGMSVLYIVKDQNGKLVILDTPEDEALEEHINTLLQEEEIAALVNDVNNSFEEAVKKDKDLKTLVEKLATDGNATSDSKDTAKSTTN